MIPILYPIILGLGISAAYIVKRKDKGMTPERELAYQQALAREKDPTRLRYLADAFRKEGLTLQADTLEKRAKLRELPPEIKAARKQAFKDAMKSTDVPGILRMADAYEKEAAFGAAQKLRQYAKGLSQ